MDRTLEASVEELRPELEQLVASPFALPGRKARMRLARREAERIARAVPVADLPAFEELLRPGWRRDRPGRWKRLSSIDGLEQPLGVELLGLLSFHPNGRLREAAVARLAVVDRPHAGRAVAYLLLRVNDWVGPVRARAVAALGERVRAGPAGAFLEALPLVARLERLGRADHRRLTESVLALLVSPEQVAELGAACAGCDRSARRDVLQALLRLRDTPWVQLHAHLGQDEDPCVRLRIGEGLASAAPAPGTERALEALTADHHPGVRERSMRALLDTARPRALALLEPALWDLAASVRLLARFQLERERPGLDVAELYRRGVVERSGRELRAALAGLAETGDPGDLDLVLGRARGPGSSAVVRAALAAAWRLDRERARPLLLEALEDPRPGVVRCAAALLRRGGGRVEAERLRHLAARPVDSRRALLPLVLDLEPWNRIGLWPCFADPGPALAARVSELAAHEPLPSPLGPYSLPPPPAGTVDAIERRLTSATWLSGRARAALLALLEQHRLR